MPTGVYERNQTLRPQTFKVCEHCSSQFGPVDHLNRRFCSTTCKVEAQRTGRKTFRKTITKARSAQSLLRYHVQAGNITRPNECEECGAVNCKIEGAHFDYGQPLVVRWLCVSCHRKWDKKDPKGATVIDAEKTENLTGKTATLEAA